MGIKFDLLNDIRANIRIGAFGYGKRAIGGALNFIEVGKFIDVAPALEAEMLKQIESRRLGDNRHGKFFSLSNNVVREILFVDCDRNSVLGDGRGSYLRHGVDNASVILVAVACAKNEQAVLNVKQNLTVHLSHLS